MTASRVFAALLLMSAAGGALSACATPDTRHVEFAAALRNADPRSADSSPYGLYLAGEAALDSGANHDAAMFLSRASQSAPDAGYLRERAFTAALLAGDIAKAAQLAPAVAAENAGARALSRLVRGVEALSEGRAKEAEAVLATPPTERAGGGAAALLRPWAAAEAGDWQTALAPPDPSDRLFSNFGALSRALLLERAGRMAEADALYKSLGEQKAGVFALGYGEFLERRGRPAEAVAVYDKALAQTPDTPALVMARARAAAGRPAPALPSFREGAAQALISPAALMFAERQSETGITFLRLALRLDPHLDEAWVLIGDFISLSGDNQAARDAYEHVRAGTPEYAIARSRIALLLQQGGDKEGALKLARETLQAAPDDPQAQLTLADLLRDDERFDEAVPILDRLVAERGDGPLGWRYYYQRGATLERAGRWPAAEADLQKALQLKPDDPEVLNYLGFAWVDRGEHLQQALGMLEKAVSLEPKSGAILDSLGWAHYRLGDYPKALGEIEKAVALDPADPEINDHLGDVYWRLGRKVEAGYQWRRVLTLEPDAKIKARAEAKLTSGLPAETTSVAAAADRRS